MSDPVKVFVSYSHQDRQYLADDSLLGFLKGLEDEDVELWTDREIPAGADWDAEIKANLRDARVALALVSQAFLDSKYCRDVEIEGLLAQQTHLIPVILSPCEWERHEWLKKRQFLPRNGKNIERHYADPGARKELFLEVREGLRQRIETIRRTASAPAALMAYYQSRIDEWSDERYALDTRFVELTLLLDQGEEAQGQRWAAQARRFESLGEVLATAPDQALVLLGPPGCGKSTLLRHFELDNARSVLEGAAPQNLADAPLTFFIQLNDYRAEGASPSLPEPMTWLAERWRAKYPEQSYPDLPGLTDLLGNRRMTLLLDALNEIPVAGDEPIERWKQFLRDLHRDRAGNRVIFSCRSLDYSASLSSKDLPVPQVRIEPLSDHQVQRFLELYCHEHHQALWRNLAGSPQLELLRSPYYLKLLVAQTRQGEIPEGRAALFTGFVRQALKREVEAGHPLFRPDELLARRDCQRLIQAPSWRTPWELPSRGILCAKLSELAHGMQSRRGEREAAQVRVAYDDALILLDHQRGADILRAGEAIGVLEEDLGRDEVLYVHQLLQEYFAARELAQRPEPERVRVAWEAERVSPGLAETLAAIADSDPLPPLPGTGWEETTVLAAAMQENPDAFVSDLMQVNLPLAGRCAAQPDVTVAVELRSELQRALIERTKNPRADLRARMAAGLALGELGDPRFERRSGPEGEYLWPPLVQIPGGSYRIGSDQGLYEGEGPAHPVELKPFRMGRFPVTNAEWALFMKAGGYDDERWWVTEEDQAWQSGKSTAEGPKRQWRENRQTLQKSFEQIRVSQRQGRLTSEQADDWERIARMSDDEFEALLDTWYPSGRQTQPGYWRDDRFNSPSQPVVGICWHEARAYCAWLGAHTQQPFRLPTEAEWEAAARGPEGRRYAYGNDFEPALANTFESHIRRTTPIGVFPGGGTPEGLADMTGNIWDWTSSLYQPYPYDPTDGREHTLSGDGRRVVRGGSWFGDRECARAASRHGCDPNHRDNDIGFRLVCLAPIF